MASSITPPGSHTLTFANPNKLSSHSSLPRRPPPTAFPSHSPSWASDSVLCLCHGRSSDSPSPSPSDRSVPWGLDSVIQGFVRSAVQSFDSYMKSQKGEEGNGGTEEADKGDSGDEWDWDRWKKHFEEVYEQERLIYVLKFHVLAAAIEAVADALREGNEAMREGNTFFGNIARSMERLPMKEQEIFDMLVELGISQPHLMKAYLFFVKHPDELRAILGCPREMRKDAIMEIVFPSTPTS